MLVPEQKQLFGAEEQVQQDGQVDSCLDDRPNVELGFKALNRFLLCLQSAVPAAEELNVADVADPGSVQKSCLLAFSRKRLGFCLVERERKGHPRELLNYLLPARSRAAQSFLRCV